MSIWRQRGYLHVGCLVAFFHSDKMYKIHLYMHINRRDTGRPDKSDPVAKFDAIIIQHPLPTDNDLICLYWQLNRDQILKDSVTQLSIFIT